VPKTKAYEPVAKTNRYAPAPTAKASRSVATKKTENRSTTTQFHQRKPKHQNSTAVGPKIKRKVLRKHVTVGISA